MSEFDLHAAWKALDEKVNQQAAINTTLLQEIAKGKIQMAMDRLTPIKWFTLVVGALWLLVLTALAMLAWNIHNWFLFGSVLGVALCNAVAVIIYAVQLIWIYQTNWQGPVLETQHQLLQIRTSTLWIAKLLFLQTPFWSTFYWSPSLFTSAPWYLLALQISVTVVLAVVAGWLFANIRIENSHKRWFKMIFQGNEWDRVQEALEWNKKV